MKLLYVTSDRPGVGKTITAMALLSALMEDGQRVGYFKPFCRDPKSDEDVSFARDVAAQGDGGSVLDPLELTLEDLAEATPTTALELAKAVVDTAAANCDILIIEGPSLSVEDADLSAHSVHVAKGLGAKALVVVGCTPLLSGEELCGIVGAFGDGLLGTVLNSATCHRVHEIQQMLQRQEATAAKPLGVVPEDRLMLSISLSQLAERLEGRWVWGQEKGDNLVENFLIGGNLMDSGDTYFNRGPANAVIVRGDRPDIQMAALNSPTEGLILTGGHQPVEYVYHEVEQLDVPLIVAPGKTAETVEALGIALDGAHPYHPRKVTRFRELLSRHCDLKGIIETLV